jgi:PAS domain S-box-containing protein
LKFGTWEYRINSRALPGLFLSGWGGGVGNGSIDTEFRFRVIAEHTADWLFWILQDGSVDYVSPACERISGFSARDLLSGKVLLRDYVHPDDYAVVRGWFLEAIEGASRSDAEFRIRRKDGKIRWGSLSYQPVADEDGRRHGFRGCIRDITDRKEAQDRLERERELLDKVVSSLNTGLMIVDRERAIVWYNSVIVKCRGPLAEHKGKSCFRLLAERDAPCPECPVTTAFADARPATVKRYGSSLPNGELRDYKLIATPIEGPDGAPEECLALILDVTETRAAQAEKERLRRQLIQAQKMEAIGTLAGGVAHEFNNLLTGILGFTSLLQMQVCQESSLSRPLTMIEKSARRGAELTGQLLGFARKGAFIFQEVQVNDIARSVLSIIRPTFDRAIRIKEFLGPDIPAVDGDPGQLEQVLLNLCINARDAMPEGGTLTLETRNLAAGEEPHALPIRFPREGGVCLSIIDTGTGIPPSVRERIFEPFFTTKGPGKGTGMGLSVVYGIVQGHGGAVDVECPSGGGTVFRVYLPARE